MERGWAGRMVERRIQVVGGGWMINERLEGEGEGEKETGGTREEEVFRRQGSQMLVVADGWTLSLMGVGLLARGGD